MSTLIPFCFKPKEYEIILFVGANPFGKEYIDTIQQLFMRFQ